MMPIAMVFGHPDPPGRQMHPDLTIYEPILGFLAEQQGKAWSDLPRRVHQYSVQRPGKILLVQE
jgi:hypothetical protein